MMKMATGDDSPSGRMPERGLDWFLVATEACGGGTPGLDFFSWVHVFIGIFGVGNESGGSSSQPRGRGRALHPRGWLGALLAQLFYSEGFFWSIKNHQKWARQLDSVWYSFSVKLKKQGKKQKLALGSRLIG